MRRRRRHRPVRLVERARRRSQRAAAIRRPPVLAGRERAVLARHEVAQVRERDRRGGSGRTPRAATSSAAACPSRAPPGRRAAPVPIARQQRVQRRPARRCPTPDSPGLSCGSTASPCASAQPHSRAPAMRHQVLDDRRAVDFEEEVLVRLLVQPAARALPLRARAGADRDQHRAVRARRRRSDWRRRALAKRRAVDAHAVGVERQRRRLAGEDPRPAVLGVPGLAPRRPARARARRARCSRG